MSVHIPWHSTDKWWESLTLGKQPKALLLFPVRPAVHLDIPSWACSQCISVPPLGIITLVLSSPLLLPPPHLTLPTCNCGIFPFLGRAVWSTQESLWSVLYWKASSITCKEKKSVPLVEFQHLYSQPDPICLIDFRFHLFCWDVFQQWLLWVFCKLLPISNIFPSCFCKYKYWFMTHSLAVNPML